MAPPVIAQPVPGLPLLGNAVSLWRRPLDFVVEASRAHPEAVTIRLGPEPAVMVTHPDLIRTVLVRKARSFAKGRQFEKARHLVGNGLLSSNGDFHLRQRRLAQPAFHHQRIAGYTRIMRDLAVERSRRWRHGQAMNLDAELRALTLGVVARTLFSSQLDDRRVDELARCFLYVQQRLTVRLLLLPDALGHAWLPGNRRFHATVERMRRIARELVAEYRKAGVDHGDLLSMLMFATDPETGEAMSDEQLTDEAITMLLAGFETTAGTLGWALYRLARHPEVEARLHAEVDEVLDGGAAGAEEAARMPYLRQVVTEVLRLYPPGWLMSRRTLEEVEVGDLTLPKGLSVMVSTYALHRDPRFWEEPDRFDPERWTGGPESAQRGTYLPFGAGVHRCIGEPFAWTEVLVALGTIAARWRFRLAPGAVVKPLAGGALVPSALPMVAEARR